MEGHAALLNGMTRTHQQYYNLVRMGIDRQPIPMLIISSYIGRVLYCHSYSQAASGWSPPYWGFSSLFRSRFIDGNCKSTPLSCNMVYMLLVDL